MTRHHSQPPAPEDLPELCLALVRRLERLEGIVQQLHAQGNAAVIGRPTWRDIEPLQEDVRRLKKHAGLGDE